MRIIVKRITSPDLWRECAEMTTGKPCKMSWFDMLKTGHSPIREQRYLITFIDVPLFVCGHIIRHDKFSNPYVRSKRIDNGGEDFREVCGENAQIIKAQTNNIKYAIEDGNVKNSGDIDCEAELLREVAKTIEELPTRFDRYAPTSFCLDVNAEEIIAISRARLCSKASAETRLIWQQVLDLLEDDDPDLVKLCKRPCVWHGFCRERKSCGYMVSSQYLTERANMKSIFKPKV